jgi:hypothetical protein
LAVENNEIQPSLGFGVLAAAQPGRGCDGLQDQPHDGELNLRPFHAMV